MNMADMIGTIGLGDHFQSISGDRR